MSLLSHPSDLSPALPGVSLTLQDGWEQVPAGWAMLRATRGGHGPDAPMIEVAVHTQGPGQSLASTLRDLADRDRHREAFQVDPPFDVDLDGRTWSAVNVTWGTSTPSVAVHLATVIERGAVQQVVAMTGRTNGPDVEQDYGQLQAMFETVTITVGDHA